MTYLIALTNNQIIRIVRQFAVHQFGFDNDLFSKKFSYSDVQKFIYI